MSNTSEISEISSTLINHPDERVRKLGCNLRGMVPELRKDESVASFLREQGGEEAVARILAHIEYRTLESQAIRFDDLEIPPKPSNVFRHPATFRPHVIHNAAMEHDVRGAH